MHEITLTGIPGSNPLGAMAAFGLFRICHVEQPFGNVHLSWRLDTDWRPILHTENQASRDDVIEFLINRQSARSMSHELTWDNDIKSSPDDFREQLMTAEIEEIKLFLTAFGSEVVTAKSTPDVKPTAFHMTAGQQKFLSSARDLSKSLDPAHNPSRRDTDDVWVGKLTATWNETLFGPWTYSDNEHSLGWDPTTEGLYALSDRSPSSAGPSSVRGAVWLAFESLPLFPSAPILAGRGTKLALHTTGFNAESEYFTWPVWEAPITLESLECILSAPDLCGDENQMIRLLNRGCSAVFRSQCLRDGNGRGTFRNARQLNNHVGVPSVSNSV